MIIKELWRSKLGKIGLVLLVMLMIIASYVWISFPKDFGKKIWNNPAYWADYPQNAPPAWTGIFGKEKMLHRVFESSDPKIVSESSGKTYLYSFKGESSSQPPEFLSFSLSEITFWEVPPTLEIYLKSGGRELQLYQQIIPESRQKEQRPAVLFRDFPLRTVLTSDPEIKEKVESFFRELRTSGQNDFIVLVLVKLADNRDGIGKVKFVLGGEAYGFLGTDSQGRDLFQGILYGLPIALMIAFAVSITTTAIGAYLAGVSGYYGGAADNLIQRLIDLMSHFPLFVLLVFLVFVLSPNLLYIVLILIIFGWPGISINLRPWILQIRTSGFIEYARSQGFSARRIIIRHILSQTLPYLLISAIFSVPSAILAEAGLSFLGLGDPSLPTWGQLLEQSYNTGAVFLGYWWQVLPPGLAIIGTILIFWFILQALEPIVEPRLKEGKE